MLGMLVLGTASMFASHYGVIFGTYVKYKSATEVYISSGSGRCNDTEWNHYSESTLDLYSVLPTGEDFVYIYVDYSAFSGTTPTFIGSLTEPTYSDSKSGWYNGNDRCIGVVWINSSGDIAQFQNNSNQDYLIIDDPLKQVLTNGNPNSTYQFLDASDYSPVNSTAIYVSAHNKDATGNSVVVTVCSYENTHARITLYNAYGGSLQPEGWIYLERSSSRDLQWFGYDNDNSEFNIWIWGYRIER